MYCAGMGEGNRIVLKKPESMISGSRGIYSKIIYIKE